MIIDKMSSSQVLYKADVVGGHKKRTILFGRTMDVFVPQKSTISDFRQSAEV